MRQLTTGLQGIGGFNALIAPPWRPAGASTKGATLEELLDADDTNYIGRRIRVIIAGGFVAGRAGPAPARAGPRGQRAGGGGPA